MKQSIILLSILCLSTLTSAQAVTSYEDEINNNILIPCDLAIIYNNTEPEDRLAAYKNLIYNVNNPTERRIQFMANIIKDAATIHDTEERYFFYAEKAAWCLDRIGKKEYQTTYERNQDEALMHVIIPCNLTMHDIISNNIMESSATDKTGTLIYMLEQETEEIKKETMKISRNVKKLHNKTDRLRVYSQHVTMCATALK